MAQKSIRGSIRCLLSGGPLDGAQFGDVPDPGHTIGQAKLSIPLSQPADMAPRAVYVCARPGTADEIWQFDYAQTTLPLLPVGTEASFA